MSVIRFLNSFKFLAILAVKGSVMEKQLNVAEIPDAKKILF